MSHTRTLTFTPGFAVEREAITLTSAPQFDNGTVQYLNRAARPLYRFTVKLGPLTKNEVDCISALHNYHLGGKSFFWDGGEYGRLDTYHLVNEGNGVRTQFFLPNRNIGAGSLSIRTQRGAANSVWAVSSSNGWPYSLTAVAGIVSFPASSNTTPASGDDLQAQYACQYRLHFAPNGIHVSEFARGLYEVELDMLETGYTG